MSVELMNFINSS